MLRKHPIWLLVPLLTIAACSSDSGTGAADAPTDTGDAPSEAVAEEPTSDLPVIPDIGRPDTCPADAWITSVSGAVVDESGAPIEAAKVQLCIRVSGTGRLLCLRPVDSRPDGAYTIVVPDEGRCQAQAVVRVLLPVTTTASTYCRIDLPDDEANIALDEPFVLFATTPAADLPEGDPAVERTVVFADGLEVDIVPDRLFLGGDGYAGLAARRIATDHAGLCFVDAGLALDGLYAFSPEGNITGESATVRIPVSGLTPGSAATLYALGALNCTLPDETPIEEGDFAEVGTGVVDELGQFVEGTGLSGLPCFSWLGYQIIP